MPYYFLLLVGVWSWKPDEFRHWTYSEN